MYKKIFVTVSTKFDKFENNYNLAKRLNIMKKIIILLVLLKEKLYVC